MIEMNRPCLADIVKDDPLNEAEAHLVKMCKTGEFARFGAKRPTAGTQQNTIRAGLIRHIMLGGCADLPVGPKGAVIEGAWITDVLDLQGCETPLDLVLGNCQICETPVLRDARLGAVMLPGTAVPGLDAHRLKVARAVLLKQGFESKGTVNLSAVAIGGALDCNDGVFDGADGVALECNAMAVGASIFLSGKFKATGQVNLVRVQIEGNLMCAKAEFKGNLDCEGLTVGGGFRYDRMNSEVSVRERLDWIETSETKVIERGTWARSYVAKDVPDANAQPYTQLARVLDEEGHRRDAASVRYQREKRVRRAQNARRVIEAAGPEAGLLQMLIARVQQGIDYGFGVVFGFGHKTFRAFLTFAAIWAFCWVLYGAAYNAGQMAPNSDVVLTSDEWQAAAEQGCATVKLAGCEMPLHLWQASHTATDYETFNRGLYALDLFVPLDALGQENAWAPSKDRGALGWWAYYLRWAVQMSGWIITAVAAAALTGLSGARNRVNCAMAVVDHLP